MPRYSPMARALVEGRRKPPPRRRYADDPTFSDRAYGVPDVGRHHPDDPTGKERFRAQLEASQHPALARKRRRERLSLGVISKPPKKIGP